MPTERSVVDTRIRGHQIVLKRLFNAERYVFFVV